MKVREGYHARVIKHSLLWVNGISRHNSIDGECVHDFSCCEPSLFTTNLEARQLSHTDLINRIKTKKENSHE